MKETIDCQKENDSILEEIQKKIEQVIEDSHTLPKREIRQLNELFNKALQLRKRIEKCQMITTKKLLQEHSKKAREYDSSYLKVR